MQREALRNRAPHSALGEKERLAECNFDGGLAGWTRRGAGQGGPLFWSGWTFQDDGGRNWQGTFFVLETRAAGPRECLAYLRAGLAPA